MKFHFMDAHREEFRIASLCRVLGVSRSGYYAWRGRPMPRRQERNLALLAHIRDVHEASMRNYGSPRVHHALLKRGVACGRHRVARLMRYEGIVSRTQKHFRWTSTKRSELPAAPDRLEAKLSSQRAQSRLGLRHHVSAHWAGLALSRHRARPLLASRRRLGDASQARQGARARSAAHGRR